VNSDHQYIGKQTFEGIIPVYRVNELVSFMYECIVSTTQILKLSSMMY